MRRRKRDLIQVYRTVVGIDRVSKEIWFNEYDLNADGTITRASGGAHNFIKGKYRLDIRKYYWSQRVVNDWNLIPSEIKLRSTVQSFRVALDSYFAGTYKEAPASNAPRKLVNH